MLNLYVFCIVGRILDIARYRLLDLHELLFGRFGRLDDYGDNRFCELFEMLVDIVDIDISDRRVVWSVISSLYSSMNEAFKSEKSLSVPIERI